MNILEQEDLIKGLPDEVLVGEAQAPTGNIPQYLVVSEIQRREKMRSKFDEQVPQETVTDQIISGGIAAMNPNPDPLMGAAMGAPDPMMGQDPMMQQMPQDPMMMQDPMMGQMPQDLAMGQQMPQDPMMQPPMQDPMMQDPMMQQQMMAAGGGMMPYRMDQGRETPFPLEYNITNMGGGSYINEGGVYARGRRDDMGSPVLNRMGNQIMYAEGDPEKETILGALGEDTGVGGGVQGVIDRAVQKGLSQEQVPKLIAGALNLRRPPDIGELTQALEAHGFYVPPLEEIAAEYPESQESFAGSLSEEENSGIDVARLAQSSVKPSISSTALRDDVSRSAKPKLGEAGFLEGFDPELARLISAPEAGSVKVNPRVAAKQEAEAENLDALNVLEELGSARYEIQRGDTLSGIAQAHGTTVEALALANKISNPDMIYAGETLEMAAGGGMMPFRMANVGEVPSLDNSSELEALIKILVNQGIPIEQATNLAKESIGTGDNFTMPTLESLSQGMGSLSYAPKRVDYGPAIAKVNTARDTALAGLGENKLDFMSVYDEDKNNPKLDFSSFVPPYAQLIADAEGRATAIKDEAKKDSGSQALIALGAGISEGNLGQGIRDAGTRMTDIRSQARKEASAESQLARRMEFAGKENEMNLGIKGQEAFNVEASNRRGAIINQFKADRELQLDQLKITDQAARDQLNLEVKSLEADYSRGKDEYDAAIERFVKQGALLRYRDLEAQSSRSLDRSILTAIARPIEDAFKEWNRDNTEATPEEKANYLRSILSQFITLPEIENYSANPENGTSSGRANGMSIVKTSYGKVD